MPERRLLLRVVALAAAIGIAAELLVDGHAAGINFPLVVTLVIVSALAVRPRGRVFDWWDAWLPVAAVVVAGFVAIRDDPALVFFDVAGAVALAGASVAAFAGASVTRATLVLGLSIAAQVAAAAVVGAVSVARRLRVVVPARRVIAGVAPRVAPVARGLAIALPIAAVFALLFSAADPIFASLGSRLFGWTFDLGEVPYRVAFVAVTAWVGAGLLGLVATGDVQREARSLGAAAAAPPLVTIGVVEALTVVVALDVLFGAFVALQLAYLFGGLDTLAASGLAYSTYARRGFFELLAVGVLTGLLVTGVEAVVSSRPRSYVVALLVLVALTGVVVVSSFLRLRLYQDAYGWTELRFYVLASIVFLGLSFAAAALLIVTNNSRWLLNVVAGLGVAVFVAINLVAPQAFVTQQNLARAIDPSLVPPDGEATLDTTYLASLGADSVPALVDALPRVSEDDRARIDRILRDYAVRLRVETQAEDLVAWNLARARARDSLVAAGIR